MPKTLTTTAQMARGHEAVLESDERTTVTVIGLGMMGQALAGAFLEHGHQTTVWNRSPGKADDLVAKGALHVATAAEAVAASRVVVICVSDYDAVRAIVGNESDDALAGRALVNLTSGTPEQARELAAWAVARGADYLDGAIMAIPPGIGQPDTLLLYSGSAAVFEGHQSMLELLGGRTTYLGADAGLAALYDMGLLSMMYALYGGFLHALALVGTGKVDGATFMPYATGWLNDVLSWLPHFASDIDAGRFATDISSLDINKDGISHIVHTSESLGISADVLRPMQALIDRRVAEGHGSDGLPSLIEALRGPTAAA
jgi:3-hydroxyisobutyrate dehydrogenase-like beta-hydroxyacid dehydrogenase